MRTANRVAAVAVMCLILPTAGACGRRATDTPTPSIPATTAPAPPPASPPAPRPSPTTARATSQGGSPLIRWMRRFTPAGGGGGRYESVYVSLMQGRCADAYAMARGEGDESLGEPLEQPVKNAFLGAAAACLAAFDGRGDLWKEAQSLAATVQAERLNCWEREVYDALAAALRAHRAAPRARFRRGEASGATKCPYLTGIKPDHGPRTGGYEVTVTGKNLPASLRLLLVGQDPPEVTATRTGEGSAVFVMPPASGTSGLTIRPSDQIRGAGPVVGFAWD